MQWTKQAPKCHVQKTQYPLQPWGSGTLSETTTSAFSSVAGQARGGGRRVLRHHSNETLLKSQEVVESQTTWGPHSEGRLSQPSVGTRAPKPPLCPAHPTRGLRAAGTTPSSEALAKLAGRQDGASECPLDSREKGSHSCLLPPLGSLQTGISENGFHNSVIGNQLFTASLPTNSQTVTVSKIISGLCPTALL